jgi:predicted phosphodiesterase
MKFKKKDLSKEEVSVQYMSDLHLERIKYNYQIVRAAPILILAGDIGRFCDYDLYRNFLAQQCDKFDSVLLVAGNHEFYGCSRAEGLDAAAKLVKDPGMHGRLYFLNRDRMDFPDSNLIILGCTLQSHIAPDYTALTNDFRRIKDWTVGAHNEEHNKDLDWLRESLHSLSASNPKPNIVIVTHYAPLSERTCHPGKEHNAVSQCFCSNALENLQQTQGMDHVSHWIFGHTHWNVKFPVGQTIVRSNQLCNDEKNLSWWQKKTIYRAFDTGATIHLRTTPTPGSY